MNLQTRFSVPEHVMARQVADETVILDLNSGTYYGLDHVGVRMWELLSAGKTLAEVCDVVASEYAVERPALEHDLLALVQSLVDKKLVVASSVA